MADPDVWMRKNGDIYEYSIATYVDNLAICMKDPTEITTHCSLREVRVQAQRC